MKASKTVAKATEGVSMGGMLCRLGSGHNSDKPESQRTKSRQGQNPDNPEALEQTCIASDKKIPLYRNCFFPPQKFQCQL